MLRKVIILMSITLLLSACGEVPLKPLNLSYNIPSNSVTQNDVKIALVKPKYNNIASSKQMPSISQSSPFGALLSKQMDKMLPVSYKINQKFNDDYAVSLENSMSSDIEGIVKSNGFHVVANAVSEDDITYAQKKSIDLIIEPVFDMAPVVKVTKEQSCNPYFCTDEEGIISLGGKIYLNFVEPMSKEKMLIKTVDISSLSGSGILQQVSYAGYSNAENAVVDLINGIYPVLMSKISNVIDKDEIMTTISDVKHLKQKQQ